MKSSQRLRGADGVIASPKRVARGDTVRAVILSVVLLPAVGMLLLAGRTAVSDLQQWRDAESRASSVVGFADAAELEEALRAEWYAGLDSAALSNDGSSETSELFAQRAAQTIAEDASQRFARATGATDEQSEVLSGIGRLTIEDLDVVRDRVRNNQIIPVEVDLFYSRIVDDVSGVGRARLDDAAGKVGGSGFAEVQAQAAMAEVGSAANRLRHELTLAIGRGLVGGGVDWRALSDGAGDLLAAERRLVQLRLVDSSWTTAQTDLRSSAAQVSDIASNARLGGDSAAETTLPGLVVSRTSLASAVEVISEARLAAVDRLVVDAANDRRAARRALLISGALVILAVLLTAIFLVRGYRSIAGPLDELANFAHQLSRGEVPDRRVRGDGPREVRAVAATLDDVGETMRAIKLGAEAIDAGDLNDPQLNVALPGALGASFGRSIDAWRGATMQLNDELATDALTGVASRRRLDELLHDSPRASGLIIGLDRFKDINDSAGQETGDVILGVVAKRLANHPEVEFVSRLWSDEFATVMPGKSIAELMDLGDELRAVVAEPIITKGTTYRVTASAGAVADARSDDFILHCRSAMRVAKATGGNVATAFDTAFLMDMAVRSRTEGQLVQAIADDELALYFQPVIDLGSGRVTSCEALVRWPQADGSVTLPWAFVPIAEQSELILDLDAWVINEACSTLASWTSGPMADVRLAVNVSARHLVHGDLVGVVRSACELANIEPERLGIEVTESYLAEDTAMISRTLDGLHDVGVTLMLDDFGTGYSSLAVLQDFPFDILKIDRAFVSQLNESPSGAVMIDAMVRIARSLDLRVVAEGIETDADLEHVRSAGCDYGQGYGIARPIGSVAALTEFCTERAGNQEVPDTTTIDA